jgi:dTDP-4-dehydrorhamnose reductase
VKILVTGAGGLLGTRICELALKNKHTVYSTYSQHTPTYGTQIKLDITDKTALTRTFEKVKPDAVVHAAAISDVDKCEKEKALAWKINTEATGNIAEQCFKKSCFLLYVSTDYVFDGSKGNYLETDLPNPINYYGLTKLEGEISVKKSNAKHCAARTSVLYGANPAAGKINFALWLINKLQKKEEVKIVTDQRNSPTYNTNLAEMILEIVEKQTTGTFHLAGAEPVTRYKFAQRIAETFELDPELISPTSSENMSWLAKRPKDTSLNVEKASQRLSKKPIMMHEALEKMKKEMKLLKNKN